MSSTPSLRAGAGQVDITPDCPVLLAGTVELRQTALVQSRLYASVIVVDDGAARLVLVSLDLLFLDDDLCTEIRERVAAATATSPERVMVCCTHTHNGPTLFKLLPQVAPNAVVAAGIKDRIVATARCAASRLVDATMFCARDTVARAFNRRTIVEGGILRFSAGPLDPPIIGAEGPADQDLLCAWFEDPAGKPIGVLVNFGAHPTHWTWQLVISADFPGEMRAAVQRDLGAAVPVLYLQGACGNTATTDFARAQRANDSDRNADCEATGRDIGGSVLTAIRNPTRRPAEAAPLACESRVIDVPARHGGPEDMSLEEARTFLAAHADDAPRPYTGYDPEAWARYWAASVARFEGAEPFRASYPVEVSLYRLGELAIVTSPAELFVEYQLEMKMQSPFAHTMVAELANGYCGYVPTTIATANGGYECRLAFSSYLAPEAGVMWVETAVGMLRAHHPDG